MRIGTITYRDDDDQVTAVETRRGGWSLMYRNAVDQRRAEGVDDNVSQIVSHV